jgi:spermidine/putrescine transport system substrate-binding protein
MTMHRPKALSRRSLLKGASAIALSGAATTLSTPFIGRAEAATLQLRALMWEPYVLPEMIAAFEAEHGAKFSTTFFDGNSEAYNKLKLGGTRDFDLVQADGFWSRLYHREGLPPRFPAWAPSSRPLWSRTISS